ncbi:hypothetical protein PENSPDRAFT_717959 [Peniophora sp. CONT]|nr:hypothetical protein PENSPDRAFT_717959 [Peniophora sp. CONT]
MTAFVRMVYAKKVHISARVSGDSKKDVYTVNASMPNGPCTSAFYSSAAGAWVSFGFVHLMYLVYKDCWVARASLLRNQQQLDQAYAFSGMGRFLLAYMLAVERIDFDHVNPDSNSLQRKPQPKGHVVAVRIMAENPETGFKPSSGALRELNFVSTSMPQSGHIFAYGQDRSESRKNMVVALKELIIRDDFRTPVECLIELLKAQAFDENTITTGWLDNLILNKLMAERPDLTLAVICCEYKHILDKGQIPSRDILRTFFGVEFIYKNFRYSFTATRSSRMTGALYLNGGGTMVGVRSLADGGLLALLDDISHSVYWREEVGALRVMIDSKTCLIEQENDPTQLRSASPGKLVRFLVDSGDHVNAGDACAEIEVMKMRMPLAAAEDGIVQFVKQPGVTLKPGDILGILDDPPRVKHVMPFDGLLPVTAPPAAIGNKPHQKLALYVDILINLNHLEGFDNSAIINATFKSLVGVCTTTSCPTPRRPPFPRACLVGLFRASSRIASVRCSTPARGKGKSSPGEFPATRVKKQLDHYLADMRAQDRTILRAQLAPIYEVIELYAGGLKSHEVLVITSLLARYADTEKLFGSSIEAYVLALPEQHKDALDNAASLMLSHINALTEAKFVLTILDYVKSSNMPAPASLEGRSFTQVSLEALEVLIVGQMPSSEDRLIKMEAVLKASLCGTSYGDHGGYGSHMQLSPELLKELSNSHYTVYDVLPTSFANDDPWLALAAFCNHTFMSFVYNSPVTYDDVLEAISGFIEHRNKQIRISLKDSEGNVTPLRCIIENVSGFIVNFHGYQEGVTDRGTTILSLPSKESLQPKRYQAYLIGTTYVCRQFYWATRVRLAQASAIEKLGDASPDMSLCVAFAVRGSFQTRKDHGGRLRLVKRLKPSGSRKKTNSPRPLDRQTLRITFVHGAEADWGRSHTAAEAENENLEQRVPLRAVGRFYFDLRLRPTLTPAARTLWVSAAAARRAVRAPG